MNKNQNNQPVQTRGIASLPTPATEQQYGAPNIEIIDIEMEQNILGGSQVPDMPGSNW